MTKISFFSNPFNKTFEDVKTAGENASLSRKEKRASEIYADKPFSREYENIASLAGILSIIAGLVSFATALFALQSILFFTVGNILSWGLAGLLCLCFELLKTLIWKVTAKQKLKYKKAVGGLIVTLLFLHAFSLLSSGYGAYLIPASFAPPAVQIDSSTTGAQIAKVDISELANIDKQLENTDKQISDLTPFILTPSGKKSSTTAKQISTLQAQKTALLAQKEAAKEVLKGTREKAEKADEIAASQHTKNTELIQLICICFAVFFELVYIAATLFLFYYDFRVFVDAGAPDVPEQTDAHLNSITDAHLQKTDAHPINTDAQPAPAASQSQILEQPAPRKIGFFNTVQTDAHPKKADAQPARASGEIAGEIHKHEFKTAVPAGAKIPKNYEIIIQNDSVILARVLAKLYTKDRVNSNLTAAKNKLQKGEPAATIRAAFWGEIKGKISQYEKKINGKKTV